MGSLGLDVDAEIKKRSGRLLVEAEVSNSTSLPLEGIDMRLRYDAAEFSSIGEKKEMIHHLLPGQSATYTFTLEPRRTVEEVPLILRVKARLLENMLSREVDLGPISMGVARGRPEDSDMRAHS